MLFGVEVWRREIELTDKTIDTCQSVHSKVEVLSKVVIQVPLQPLAREVPEKLPSLFGTELNPACSE